MQDRDHQAKYQKLKEYLKEEILMGRIKPGEQIPSENALTEQLSLSRHTVRKAISILVNEGYLYTEHGRGTYCSDRSKKRGGSGNIGVITTYISEYIFPSVIQGIDHILSDKGYSILLKNTENDIRKEAAYLEEMIEKNVEGLIVEPSRSALFSNNLKYYEALDRHRIPYVFIHGCYQNFEGIPVVVLDDAEGMYLTVKYLAELGHRHIAGVFKADDIQGINRHKGYAKALTEYGIAYDPDHVIWFHTEDKFSKPGSVLRMMWEKGVHVDAVACYNDEVAIRIFELLDGLGVKIPQDISITGFDDSYLAVKGPVKLTTVRHPKEKLGEAAAQMLLGLLGNDAKNPVKKLMKPELIIRDSCMQR